MMAGINEKLSHFLSEIRNTRKRSWSSSSSDCSSCSCPSSCSCRASPQPEVSLEPKKKKAPYVGKELTSQKSTDSFKPSYQNLLQAREALRKLLFYEAQKKEHEKVGDHHEKSQSSHSETLPAKSLKDRLNLFYEKVKKGDVSGYSKSNKSQNEIIPTKSLQERLNIFYEKVKKGNASTDTVRTSSDDQKAKRTVYSNEKGKWESSQSDISNGCRYLSNQGSEPYSIQASQINQSDNDFSSVRKVTLKPKAASSLTSSEEQKNSEAVPANSDVNSEIVYDSKSEGELTDDSEAEIQNSTTKICPLKVDILPPSNIKVFKKKEKGKSRKLKEHSSSEDLTDYSSKESWDYKRVKPSKRKHESTELKLEKEKTVKRHLKPEKAEKRRSKHYGYGTDSSEEYYDKKSKSSKQRSSSDRSSHRSYSPYPEKERRRYTGSIYSENSSPSRHSHYEEKGHSRHGDKHGKIHEVKHHEQKESVPYKAIGGSKSPFHKSFDSDTRSQSSDHKKNSIEHKSDYKYEEKSTESHPHSLPYPQKYAPHSSENTGLVEKEKTLRRVLNAEMVRKIQKASKNTSEKTIDEKQAEQYFQTFISKIAENYVKRMIKTGYDAAVSEPKTIPEMTTAVPNPNIQNLMTSEPQAAAAAAKFGGPNPENALLATPAPAVTLQDMEEFLSKLKANKKGIMIQQKKKT